jgi:hypothetical protein
MTLGRTWFLDFVHHLELRILKSWTESRSAVVLSIHTRLFAFRNTAVNHAGIIFKMALYEKQNNLIYSLSSAVTSLVMYLTCKGTISKD